MTHGITRLVACLLTLTASAGVTAAQPFESCPAKAFLIQDTVPRLFGVDLATGYVALLADDLGTTDRLNGAGFSYADAYIYGWSYEHRTLARLGSDFQLEPLTLSPSLNDNYFVGDMTTDGSAYYIYKKGTGGSHGLWKISLDEGSIDYLQPQRIVTGTQLQLSIYDMAFHPGNGLLYSVTSKGGLAIIDSATGERTLKKNIAESGTYGAVYFDVDEFLYISRNTDGKIFQIDVNSETPTATPYALGPNSRNNDGARCALAPVISTEVSTIDFGDAPDSYGTSASANGARHNTEGSTLWLGSVIDAEPQAWLPPLSDETQGEADEDGVVFITPLVGDETALISVEVEGSGYLNAWIDLNRDGSFSSAERIVTAYPMDSETQVLPITLPRAVESGDSWARFRFSSNAYIEPSGGLADGEVEDYPVQLFGRQVSSSFYPSPDGYVTLAFEDLWPAAGDYDMNDLVLFYRTVINTVSYFGQQEESTIDSVQVAGEVTAIGAALHSGFAVELTGIPRSAIDPEGLSLTVGGEPAGHVVLEAGAGYEDAVLIIYEDAWNHVSPSEGCQFYRTQDHCGGTAHASHFSLTAPLKVEIPASDLDDQLLNPFIFAADSRRMEIHLKNKPPTAKAYMGAFGALDDSSIPASGIYYQTAAGLPWAMVIGEAWSHPEEARDLVESYPDFVPYVTSGGESNVDWHLRDNAITQKLYEE